MIDPREDDDFEAYMDGDSPVSRRYAQLTSEEPPPELDAEILEAARQAVHPQVLPLKKSPRRWMMPVTVAATIVLSFSLVMSIVFDTSVTMTDGDTQFTTVLKEDDMAQAETRAELAETQVPNLEALPAPAAPAIRPAPPPTLSDETVPGRAQIAKKTAADGLDGRIADMPALGASAIDATVAERDTSDLLVALREVAPRADNEQIAAAEESRFRSDNETFALLRSKSLPAESDSAEDAVALDADGDLAQILALFEADEEQAALESLASFSQSWPDHPASQIYLEWSGDIQ